MQLEPRGGENDTFYLTMLASVQVAHHKGHTVLIHDASHRKSRALENGSIWNLEDWRVEDFWKKTLFHCNVQHYALIKDIT